MNKKARSELGVALVVMAAISVMVFVVTADIECTGQDCSVSTSLTVGNSVPTITDVESGITITLTGETSKIVNVIFNATDVNGFADLNDSTAQCIGFKTGEANRTSSSCSVFGQSGNDARYNCTDTFQYFDAAASDWAWNCSVSDDSAASVFNDTVTFTINSLNFVDVNETTILWAVVNSNTDDEEADAPINLDNGGNQDYESANVTAYNATNSSNIIPASAFTLLNITGATTGQTSMVENVSTSISDFFTLPRGNLSNEDIFVYVDMPALPNGIYSSTNNWLIDITA